MEWNPSSVMRRWLLLVAAICIVANSGCIVQVASVLMYRGRLAPAAYDKLAGKRVAVVCTTNSSDFGPSPNAELISKRVAALLSENVKEIDVVEYQKIASWMDEHDVDFVDYAEIGRGVKADMVVAIDVESFRLQDNQTLYKGLASYKLEVLNINNNGHSAYAPFTAPVHYPKMTGIPTTSISKEQFRRMFIDEIAADIGRHFYEHDLNKLIAADSADMDEVR